MRFFLFFLVTVQIAGSACGSGSASTSTKESCAEKRDYLLVEAVPEARTDAAYSCAVEIYLKGDGDAWILARILH